MLLSLLHGTVTRLFYRVVAPKHPRGRTNFHAVWEDDRQETLWVHTHGMKALGLHEIELTGVPVALRGYAHGILFELMGYMAGVKPIGADEHIGGAFLDENQKVLHFATARLIERPDDPAHHGFLRFVDYQRDAASGFAGRLFAAHIATLAERERSPVAREQGARLSLAAYSGSEAEWRCEADLERNPGNWLAWVTLGNALADQGRIEEGLKCFKEVMERCPAAALRFTEIYADAIRDGQLPPPEMDPRSKFWMSRDRAALRSELEKREAAVQQS